MIILDKFKHLKDYIVHVKHSNLKINVQDTLPWTIIGRNLKLKQFEKMYNGYHQRYKYMFIRPLMVFAMWMVTKINRKVLGKSLIPVKSISREKCNRVINVWNESLMQSLSESALIIKKDVEGYNDPLIREWLRLVYNLNELTMQTIIYDTVYRTVFEIHGINFAKNMVEAFKDDPHHILYNSRPLDNIDYLAACERNNDGNLIFGVEDGMILVPKGATIKLTRRMVEDMFKEIDEKKKENKN